MWNQLLLSASNWLLIFVISLMTNWWIDIEQKGCDYDQDKSVVNRMFTTMVKTTAQIFHHAFTRKPSKRKPSNQANIKMQYFQSGYLIIDFHFHPWHRPAGRFSESKHYFSGKLHEYGIKTTVHLADSRMIYCSGHSPGSTHDFQQFKDNCRWHQEIAREARKRTNHCRQWCTTWSFPWSMVNDWGQCIHWCRSVHSIEISSKESKNATRKSSDWKPLWANDQSVWCHAKHLSILSFRLRWSCHCMCSSDKLPPHDVPSLWECFVI